MCCLICNLNVIALSFKAGELDVLSTVIKWGEQQLIKRMEERGEYL